MKIGNYNSLFATNALNRTTSAIARSLQRLSTGLRVNSPQDDMAAFSEGVKLDSSIRGYTQAIRNLNDATGLLNMASSAISTQLEIVQKMRELAVQASSGTLSSSDRQNINTEVQDLYQEFQRITSTTQFNGINLLDGSFGTQTLQVGSAAGDSFSVQIPSLQASATFQKTIGSGTFQARVTNSGGLLGIAVADLNGDGIPDIVGPDEFSHVIDVYIGEGGGKFSSRITFADSGADDFGVTVADVNGDGISDVLYPTTTGVTELLGNGDGTFKLPTTISLPSSGNSVLAADLNHDGKVDLVYGSGHSEIDVLFGNGDGTFKSAASFATPSGSSYLMMSDVNGDGTPDLIQASTAGTGDIYVYYGNGNGTFQPAVDVAATGSFIELSSMADLNGDGRPDIVTTSFNNMVNVYLNNGNGTFTAKSTFASGNGLGQVRAADLNGDGIPDLVVEDVSDQTFSIFLGNGDGTFSARKTLAESNPEDFVLADVNNDGALDIVSGQDAGMFINFANSQVVGAGSSMNVASQSSAQALIGILDTTLANLKSDQATLAASQVRLDQANSYSTTMVQSLSDARSSAVGVDIAAETSRLVRNQILEQAQVAVGGQANLNMQLVLGLLKNLGT